MIDELFYGNVNPYARPMLFATDPYISHAFRGEREDAVCFSWDDLKKYNIFLRIPANKIEQWGGAINLMYTQLIRCLERRPEQYSTEGRNNVQTLVLMDEFARFGKLDMITAALSTLRSKNVNFLLVIQSMAQLDQIYGETNRRIIIDNCQYQAILRANDADTQKYLCELIGTCIRRQHSVGAHFDESMNTTGYSEQISEVREYRIFPHELATLEDVLLLTPYGFFRVEKLRPDGNFASQVKKAASNENSEKTNEGAKMLTIEERTQNAVQRIDNSRHHQRVVQKEDHDLKKRRDQQRNYIIGALVSKHFPEVTAFEPGTQAENAFRFKPLEAFLSKLASNQRLVEQLKESADISDD